jgi:hypothetical protein
MNVPSIIAQFLPTGALTRHNYRYYYLKCSYTICYPNLVFSSFCTLGENWIVDCESDQLVFRSAGLCNWSLNSHGLTGVVSLFNIVLTGDAPSPFTVGIVGVSGPEYAWNIL